MQLEQDIPDSVLVRVYVLGPLEIWKIESSEWRSHELIRDVFVFSLQHARKLAAF